MSLHEQIEISIVLVRTKYPRNIGYTSRVMANLGAQRLLLVEPQCEITFEAQLGAARSQDALNQHKKYSSMEDYLRAESPHVSVAFCGKATAARERGNLSEALGSCLQRASQLDIKNKLKLHFVFGSEDDGLLFNEVNGSTYVCGLPVFGTTSSYNLSHAVMLALFILRSEIDKMAVTEPQVDTSALIPKDDFRSITRFPTEALRSWVETLGVDLSLQKKNILRKIEPFFLRTLPTQKESEWLKILFEQTIRKLKNSPVDQIQYRPIGLFHSCFKQKFSIPRQPGLVPSSHGRIELSRALQPEKSLDGLEKFSHVWVLYHFHDNNSTNFRAKITPPHFSTRRIGLFATRAPHRPNAIGMSVVKLDRIEGNFIHIQAHDILDQTPILDIKPYIPRWDSVRDANSGWISQEGAESSRETFEVEVAESAKANFDQLDNQSQTLIMECLRNDPRAESDRRKCHHNKSYGVYISEHDVVFDIQNEKTARILQIREREATGTNHSFK
ncbi:MAG: tRNA (N6-threonylcarbamoyladenosine(37)-N6)-methyltransferase TrmO [Bdellovibrionales bacterium CG10_big_fil_rev_8_21_14_0_10_45_34]|nr:MAG: tRNA (N6-threonylcarbamoyladenosine(37)-N6)-methyltransferase TrmO [Bdellovibrionales bacterium CG10_big_fil_rev_8_21_14_0_10_45_34]